MTRKQTQTIAENGDGGAAAIAGAATGTGEYGEYVTIPCNPTLEGLANLTKDVPYKKVDGETLTMDVLEPQSAQTPEARDADRRYPLVVFVQGSSWTTPDRGRKIPQLSELAQRGFVIATVGHRSARRGHPFPAFLKDVKSAIRFLRANAARFHVDPERVGIWGTSSGGNAALLATLTADDPRYDDGIVPGTKGVSDAVDYTVACFPPTDIPHLIATSPLNVDGADLHHASAMACVLGVDVHATPDEYAAAAHDMSPCLIAESGKDLGPFLLLHGDADPLVPFDQSVRMNRRLGELGYDSRFVRVHGAIHEYNFWSQRVYEEIFAFIEAHA